MTEEVISIPSATVSLAFLLELREFLLWNTDSSDAATFLDAIDSILSNYKL